MNGIKSLMKKMGMFFVAIVLMVGLSSEAAFAASPGIYVATCTPNYRHPQTGVIEDSGGESSYALGQSMTNSVTHSQALVEVDDYGNTYVTLRLKLMDKISDVSFLIDGGQSDPVLVQQDTVNHTADYRMLVFSENSIITASLYVEPMGRYVTYYITLSGLQSGSADFVPQIAVSQSVPEVIPEAVAETTPEEAPETTPEEVPEAVAETTPEEATEEVPETTPEATEEPTAKGEEQSEGGIQEFDAEGNKIKEKKENLETAVKTEKKSNIGIWIGIILVVVVIAGGLWYVVSKKRK